MPNSSRNHMDRLPSGKRILATRAVSSGTSGWVSGCRDIAFLLLWYASLLSFSFSSLSLPFSLSLRLCYWPTESNFGRKATRSPEEYEQRLKAIALRITEWIPKHGWYVPDDKKKALYENVLTYCQMKD